MNKETRTLSLYDLDKMLAEGSVEIEHPIVRALAALRPGGTTNSPCLPREKEKIAPIITDLTKVTDVLRLTTELCESINVMEGTIGGVRAPMTIIKDISPIIAEARKQFLDAMSAPFGDDRWITSVDEDCLTGLIMKLTGGSANPAVVRAQIANARGRYEHE